jgi:hypothetical protein
MSGFLSILSALDASLKITPFCIDGDSVELIVIVLLIARALSRRLEPFKRTTKIIADNINTTAPKMPSIVPRNGFICKNVGARTGEMGMSENGKTTVE